MGNRSAIRPRSAGALRQDYDKARLATDDAAHDSAVRPVPTRRAKSLAAAH